MRFLKRRSKSVRKDPADREKRRGALEYNARVLDRRAERLEIEGDAESAAATRVAAEQVRQALADR
jgi:hypothetical protein